MQRFISLIGVVCLAILQSVVAQQITPPYNPTPDTIMEVVDSVLSSTERRSDAHFIINKWDMRPTPSLEQFRADLDSLLRTTRLISVDVESAASPDGPWKWNETLARNRAAAMLEYLREKVVIPDSILRVVRITEQWEGLRDSVVADMTLPHRDELLRIIDSNLKPDVKEQRLRALKDSWRRLTPRILPSLRYSFVRAVTPEVTLVYDSRVVDPPREPYTPMEWPIPVTVAPGVPEMRLRPIPLFMAVPPRHYYLSTNLVAAGMAIENLGFEMDIVPHWTAKLVIYHAGWDYFKSTIKFRNLTAMPEVRWFSHADNSGFFVDGHAGVGYYNVALDGRHRYQDHRGRTPAIGGGVGCGYRRFISVDHRWMIEGSIGAGIYKLDYDIFENTPDVKDGLLINRRHRTFYCIDNVAVSIIYRFGSSDVIYRLAKGGGK